jgi:NADH:ubiquinone oxidoreductase subunit E
MPPEYKVRNKYRDLVKDFPPNEGQLLNCLHAVQHHFGYIPTDAVASIAQQLKMTSAAVFGAITFYSEFRTSPPPEMLVNWCSGPTCRLKGGDGIRKALETTLNIAMEENTPGDAVGLHLQQCDGSCEYAPLVWLRRKDEHPDGPDAPLVADRGMVRGPLSVPDAVRLARRLRAGDLDV